MRLMKVCVISFLQSFIALASMCAAEESKEHLYDRIHRVENGLLPPVFIKGQSAGAMNISNRMAFHHVPGVSVAVINDGKLEWARGYGVVETNKPQAVTTNTPFQAASISKPVSAMAALALVQAGKLSLDDEVNDKLASWRVPENEFTKDKKVALRRLLTHSAGLTVHGFRGYAAGEPVPNLVEVLDGKKPANSPSIRVDLVPGQRVRYSGGGYCVMQQLLIDVAGKPFPQVVDENVLRPLQMVHSTFEQPLPKSKVDSAAVGHLRNGQPVAGKWHTYPEMAAAGLWTTPSDLAHFAIELQQARAGKSKRVFSAEMAKQMLSPQIENVGLGIFLEGKDDQRFFYHGGANEGFRAMLVAYENSGRGVAVMCNSDSGSELNEEIIRAVATEYDWPDYRPKERSVIKVDAKTLESYCGRYQLFPDFILTVTTSGGRLFSEATGQPQCELFAESEKVFFYTVVDAQIQFVRSQEGKVTELVLNQNGQTMKARRLD